MKKIRVMVVDDSALMRRMIREIISEQSDMEPAGSAKDGQEALAKIETLQPDVVTLDLEMPHMDGLKTLQTLIKRRPLPVIIVSSHSMAGSEATLKALSAGALDFIPKPAAGSKDEAFVELRGVLPQKIRAAASVKPEIIAAGLDRSTPAQRILPASQESSTLRTLVAIGASTGGPKAVETIFCALPAALPAALLLTLHMPPGFTFSFANRLNTLSPLQVKEGADGDLVQTGRAFVAPGGFHMKLKRDMILLDAGPKVNFVRPSVDVMLESLLESPYHIIVAILTGMGKDGAIGAARLKKLQKDTVILAQDPSSALIPSMPEAVLKSVSVTAVVPLEKMGAEITRHAIRLAR